MFDYELWHKSSMCIVTLFLFWLVIVLIVVFVIEKLEKVQKDG